MTPLVRTAPVGVLRTISSRNALVAGLLTTLAAQFNQYFLLDNGCQATSPHKRDSEPTYRQTSPRLTRTASWSRLFSTSILRKKVGGGISTRDADPTKKSASTTPNDDPFDFSQLHSEIADAVVKLKYEISKLHAGGRFNPEAIESLRL